MSAKNFKFVSPGVFINEIDNSQLPKAAPAVGPVVIGRFRRGPAFIPTRVESLSELIQIFGEPIRGDEASDVWRGGLPTGPTYGAYAAAAWLKNGAPITIVRILGDQHEEAVVDSAKAGWSMGSTPTNAGSSGGAYGLFLMNSGNFAEGVTGSANGVLAATWYFDSGGIILSGSIAGAATDVVSGSGVLIEADGSPSAAKFTAELFDENGGDGAGTPTDVVTFSFDKNSKYYIRKVFNTNPTRTNSSLISGDAARKKYFLGETYEQAVKGTLSGTKVYGVVLPLGDSVGTKGGQNFKKKATRSQTGWFVSQDIRTTAGSGTPGDNTLIPAYDADNVAICPRLFKFHVLSEGETEQRSYKISIENVKYSKRVDIDPYGSFSVVLRSIYDSDNAPRIVERYDNCNLNPNSANYVAKKIGDVYYEWDNTKKRLVEYGTYPNRSNFIRIQMASEVDLGQADSELLPFGAQGPVKRTGFSIQFDSGSASGIYGTGSFLAESSSYGDADVSLDILNVRRSPAQSFKWFDQAGGDAAAPNNAIIWGGGGQNGAVASATDKLNAASITDLDEFTFNVPASVGGSGTTIRVILKDALNDAAAGVIHVKRTGTPSDDAASIILAFDGTADETKVRYGNAAAGDSTNGVAGLDASAGTGNKITLTATQQGTAGNTISIVNVAGTINDAAVSFGGGIDPTPAPGQAQFLASVKFPDFFLRDGAEDGNLSDPTLAYFGFSTTSGSTDTTFDASNLDLLRALPADYGQFATSDYTKRMFMFSLDDISASFDGLSGSYSYSSGSRAAGTSVTARNGSYRDILDAGYDRFTVPLFGGFDGLDVREAEPFNIRALPSDATERTYAMYYSVKKAIDILADPEFVEMNLVAVPGIRNESLTQHLVNVCEDRGDALAIIDPLGGYKPASDEAGSEQSRITTDHVKEVVDNMQERAINSSYGCAYYPWVRINDDIGGGSLWVPPSVAAIGTMAFSDKQRAPWFAPAGFARGGLSRGAAGFPVTNVRSKLTAKERDDLYEVNINPIGSFPSEGIVVFGQKTLQVTPSALDRINVRRLMILVKKQVSRIAANLLFEQNVEATWDKFKGQVDPLLSNIRTGFGLTDFKVVLDETTTTPELVDRNIMYAKIFLKPARAIEYIAIDFNITNTGASFDD
tara:strand:+ start:3529 stop:6984 length:3456 start_codon:yes stop_codon:yes gene_type:complete